MGTGVNQTRVRSCGGGTLAARYTPFELGRTRRSETYGGLCRWVGPLVSPALWGGLVHGGQLRQILVSGMLAT